MNLILGDCVEKMAELNEESVDAVVCDPPYSLKFMGKAWDRHDDEDAAFGYYLSGLIDGEGCFRVTAKHRRCEFTMKLRDDDEWILRQAIGFVGHGRLARQPARDGSAPQVGLVIDTKDGVAALCALLLRYPLRAKKLRDFLTWAEAVDEWLTMERGNRWHGPADRSRLAELSQRIRAGRSYSEIAWSGNGFQDWTRQWSTEAFRVLKPGGHLLAFGGTRTYHRLAAGVEDAGFEIRDQIAWLYGSGFPKSLDVAKAIDAKLGARGTFEGVRPGHEEFVERTDGSAAGSRSDGWSRPWQDDPEARERHHLAYSPATEEAQGRAGWGTALKPALEPIIVARKPFRGTVAENVLAHGTGAINIDSCRVVGPKGDGNWKGAAVTVREGGVGYDGGWGEQRTEMAESGRWPANVVLDEEAAALLDEQAPDTGGGGFPGAKGGIGQGSVYGAPGSGEGLRDTGRVDANGGASRFFYCAKTSRGERNAGLSEFEAKPLLWSSGEKNPGSFQADGTDRSARNAHPTVKPIALMRWLVRLVTPPGGVVLDPFLGSGTTGCAAALEGFEFVGIEREAEYLAIADARIRFWAEHGEDALRLVAERDSVERDRRDRADAGQLDLFAEGAA